MSLLDFSNSFDGLDFLRLAEMVLFIRRPSVEQCSRISATTAGSSAGRLGPGRLGPVRLGVGLLRWTQQQILDHNKEFRSSLTATASYKLRPSYSSKAITLVYPAFGLASFRPSSLVHTGSSLLLCSIGEGLGPSSTSRSSELSFRQHDYWCCGCNAQPSRSTPKLFMAGLWLRIK